MTYPITLLSRQWADVPLAELALLAWQMGYDGLELTCSDEHFDMHAALMDPGYVERQRTLLAEHDLRCFAVSNHLVDQVVCNPIDTRHRPILPSKSGNTTAGWRTPSCRPGHERHGPRRPLWRENRDGIDRFECLAQHLYLPTDQAYWDASFKDFAQGWLPVLDVFDEVGGNFALKIHLPEIAFDTVSARRALAAVDHQPCFGFNHDSSHLAYQGVDHTGFVRAFPKRFFRVHLKAVWWGHGDGEVGVFGGNTSFGDARRFWNFHSLGFGDVHFEDATVALNDVGYDGPLSIKWEDAPMDHLHGAAESAAIARKLNLHASTLAFDAAFQKRREL